MSDLHPVNGQPITHRLHIMQAKLKEMLHYDPETGVFTWLVYRNWLAKVGDVAGTDEDDYCRITVFGKRYLAHRLAWLYVYGTLPPRVDHRDGVGTHNWILNLRECTQKQNVANTRTPGHNTSGYKGVSWHKASGKWSASIGYQGKQKHLGLFETPELAHEFYCLAADMIHGEFSNHGTHKCAIANT